MNYFGFFKNVITTFLILVNTVWFLTASVGSNPFERRFCDNIAAHREDEQV